VVIVEVQDTGIGISRDQLERIFEPFVQAETATTRKYGGRTGIDQPKFCRLLGGDWSFGAHPLRIQFL
jgi:light-regulated signal transduction histidine kinase (bacteriophytochrome)